MCLDFACCLWPHLCTTSLYPSSSAAEPFILSPSQTMLVWFYCIFNVSRQQLGHSLQASLTPSNETLMILFANVRGNRKKAFPAYLTRCFICFCRRAVIVCMKYNFSSFQRCASCPYISVSSLTQRAAHLQHAGARLPDRPKHQEELGTDQ